MAAVPAKPDAILFDWDNTLIDSWGTIHAALVETFTRMDKEPWTLEETKTRVRQSLRDSFPDLFGARWEEAAAIFYQAFERLHIEHLTPMPAAAGMLNRVHAVVPVLGVVSNKTGKYLRQEAAHLGWQSFFTEMVGAGDASRDKPDAAPVKLFRENSGLSEESRIWYVGDANIDIETAENSGCIPLLIHVETANLAQIGAKLPEITLSGCEELAAMVETL